MTSPSSAGTTADVSSDAASAAPARRAVHVALAIALVAVAAQLAVPIPGTPVPVTLQDLAVLVVGVLLGPVAGASALTGYLALGAMGAPVFSNAHGGLAWLLGPSGGYLLAYPAAAWVMGAVARRVRPFGGGERGSILRLITFALLGALAAQAMIFGGGVLQLLVLTAQDLPMAVSLGVIPFVPGIVVKTALLVSFVLVLDRFGPSAE